MKKNTRFSKYSEQKLNIPNEVMLEVEPRCNLRCEFCFNTLSFAKNGRNIKALSGSYWKKVIDGIAASGIKIVRFTGGEPLLRRDLFALMWHAKSKGLEVRLNTNGTLITKEKAKKIAALVDNVLIPIESGNDSCESEITGKKNVLTKKIQAIRELKKAGVTTVRVGSVGTKKGIADFAKMAEILLELPIDEWEWYRPISSKMYRSNVAVSDMLVLANKINKLKKQTAIKLSIANAVPFCLTENTGLMERVCVGAASDDGHTRLVVDPRGVVKPHYFVEKILGDPMRIMEAWNSSYMKKLRSLASLPTKCKKCKYKLKCKGGSRHEALMAYGRLNAPDPMMNLNYKVKIQ